MGRAKCPALTGKNFGKNFFMNNERKLARQYINGKTFLVQEEPRGPSQTIEIPVATNGLSVVSFPDIANLRNDTSQIIIIKAIRLITPPLLNNAPTSGQPLSPLTEMQKISLDIYCEGWIKAKSIPLLTLVDTFTEGSGIPYRDRTMQFANWERVDWNKSQLVYSNGNVSAGTPYTVLLEVEYVKLNPDGSELIGPN
jgi:hypothetical protein